MKFENSLCLLGSVDTDGESEKFERVKNVGKENVVARVFKLDISIHCGLKGSHCQMEEILNFALRRNRTRA